MAASTTSKIAMEESHAEGTVMRAETVWLAMAWMGERH